MLNFSKFALCAAIICATFNSQAAPAPKGAVCTVNQVEVDRAIKSNSRIHPDLRGPIFCEFLDTPPNDSGEKKFRSVAELYEAGFRITQVHTVQVNSAVGAFVQFIVESR